MILEQQILHLLLKKGFMYTFYEKQNLYFYAQEIKDPKLVEWLAEKNYGAYGPFDLSAVSVLIEISDNFEVAQYTFINGLDAFYIFEDLQEFKIILEKLPNQIKRTYEGLDANVQNK
ncbi:hypothetical protein [Lysinibacillus sp. OL1]|uniref:hypothetical protein n=1 Tax=Lysinibacillus sp. OL1 TaxID=2517243 RepID=UPI001040D30D|nr:hypothetical protein [Lysinibacillus sp. OL1]TBV85476.1 hypothetical protein EW028_21230 [Lysinibacillus sp. OL1]